MDRKKDKIIKVIKEFEEKANKLISIKEIILFGSRARGDYKKISDIDLIIVSDDFEGQKYYRRAAPFYLLWNSPYNVDIICLTPKELAIKRKQIGTIKTAMEEGIEIV